jgi:hypothetical protein
MRALCLVGLLGGCGGVLATPESTSAPDASSPAVRDAAVQVAMDSTPSVVQPEAGPVDAASGFCQGCVNGANDRYCVVWVPAGTPIEGCNSDPDLCPGLTTTCAPMPATCYAIDGGDACTACGSSPLLRVDYSPYSNELVTVWCQN